MSDMPQRFTHVRRAVQAARILGIAGVVSLAILLVYILLPEDDLLAAPASSGYVRTVLVVGLCSVGLILVAGVILLWGAVDVALKIEGNSYRTYDVLRDIHLAQEEARPLLRALAENSQLSEAARAITHRGRERTALRLAINEEIVRGDWEAAYALVEQLASRHGYKNEAARLREEVDRSREQARKEQLDERVQRVRSYMESHDWDRARREMDRLLAEHPEAPQARGLPQVFTRLRADHKRRLLKAWDEFVQRNEVDRGIAVLNELDQYLTPSEAAALQESARGVFRAKLHNLGVQFSLAVADHEWQAAVVAGREIMQEFPNSRMAAEVKDRINVLIARTEEAAAKPAEPSEGRA